MVTKNSDSWCCSECLPVILNLLISTTTFWLFSLFLQILQIYTVLSWLSSPLSTCLNFSQKDSLFQRCQLPYLLFYQNFPRFWKHWINKGKVFMRGIKRNWLMEIHTESSFWNWLFDCPLPWWAERSFGGYWQKRWYNIKHEDQTQKINRDKTKNWQVLHLFFTSLITYIKVILCRNFNRCFLLFFFL